MGFLYTGKNLFRVLALPCLLSLHSLLRQLYAWCLLPTATYIFMDHKFLSPICNILLLSGSTLSKFCYISPLTCPIEIIISQHTHTQSVQISQFLSRMLAVISTHFSHSYPGVNLDTSSLHLIMYQVQVNSLVTICTWFCIQLQNFMDSFGFVKYLCN